MKTIKFVHVDMAWTGTPGKPFQWYAWGFLRELRSQFGVQSVCSGPCKENEVLAETEILAVLLPWKGFQSKRDFRRLQYLIKLSNGRPIIFLADDPYRLQWAAPYINDAHHVLVSNYFEDPTRKIPGWLGSQHQFWPHYPFDQILPSITRPQYDLGYVGRFIPERFKLMRDLLPQRTAMLGPQWDRQLHFPSKFTQKGGLEWYDLASAYKLAHWQVMVSDSNQIPLQPAVSRIGESLVCGRPLVFHSSVCESRRDIDWEPFYPYVFRTSEELLSIFQHMDYSAALRVQTNKLFNLYYPKTDLSQFVKDFLQ